MSANTLPAADAAAFCAKRGEVRRLSRPGQATGQSYPGAPWQPVLEELNAIQRDYLQLKSGLAVRMSLGLSSSVGSPPLTGALRQELAVFAIQRLIGDDVKLAPLEAENTLTYLRRLLAAARERKDWRLVQRVLETGQSTGVQDPLLKPSDTTALTAFFAGMTQEVLMPFIAVARDLERTQRQ